MKDFFISYNKADRDSAIWIDQQLRDAGYTTTIQATDMPPGSAFVHEMDKAVEENEGLIAVLSPNYLESHYCESEWQAFYQKDPNGEKRALIPICVRECQPKGLLAQRVYIDLVGKDGAEAKRILLNGVKSARGRLELVTRHPVDDLLGKYLDQLRQKVSTVRTFGDDRRHELNQVFVELTLNEEYDHRPNQADFLGAMDTELRQMRSVSGDKDWYRDREVWGDFAKTKRTINPDELLRRQTHAVVTGAPGCGKTTLLRYLAWQTLKEFEVLPSVESRRSQNNSPESEDLNHRLPVFLELKQLTTSGFQHAQNQLEYLLLNNAIANMIRPGEAEYGALKDRFFALLHEGRVAIFLDGLDEVSGASFFKELQRAITDFLHSAYSANLVIISTRPFALRQIGDAKTIEIQPLNPRQIEQFIEHYYQDVPGRQQFQRELQNSRELRELARVPTLLGFILQVWRKRGSVTDNKLELYEQITLLLAQQLDTDKEGVQPDRKWQIDDKSGLLKRDFFRQLAFNQMFRGIAEKPYDLEYKIDDRERFAFNSDTLISEAEQFAVALYQRTGKILDHYGLADDAKASTLLREIGTDFYAFMHLTLQEYLAAWQLANRHDAATCEGIFCRAYFNPMLAEMEILPMTLGLVDGSDNLYEVLERLPESLSLTGLKLRARGLGYADVSQRTLKALIDKLDGFVSINVSEHRGYRDATVKAFAQASGENLRLILQHIAQSLAPDRDDYERERAVAALALFHHENAVMLLRKALADEDANVRICAAAAVSWCDMACAIDALKKELKNPDEEVRKKVVHTTWQSIGEQAIEVLIEALRDESAAVVEDAVEALGYVGGERVVGLLIGVLQTDSGSASEKAAEALGNIGGNEALNGLLGGLERPDCKSRGQIIKALGEIGDARAVPSLLEIIKTAKSYDREEAVKALGKIKCDQQIPYLKKLYSETKAKWTERFCETSEELGFVFGEDHESLLISLAESLLNLGENCGLGGLLDILDRGEEYYAAKAVKVLANIDSDVVNNALHTAWDKALSKYSSNKQYKGGKAADGGFIHRITFTPDLLAQLAEALTKLGNQQIVFTIVELIDDKNFIRDERIAHIANALGHCEGKEAVEGLVKIFHSSNVFSDFIALGWLGNFQNKYAITGLLRGFLAYQRHLQMRAINRMISMDNKTIFDGLFLALSDSNKFVRRKAAKFIAYYATAKDQCLIATLRLLAVDDASEKVRQTASQSMQKSELKLRYFDIPITDAATYDHSQPNPAPLLTAEEREELERRIATIHHETLRCSDARRKGKALEELLAVIFASIPGFTVSERNYNTATEEIDLVVRNASADLFWRGMGSLILVEAKHWRAQRVGKNEYVQFYRKMENRGGHCLLGFLICTERFAETFEKEMLRDSKSPLRVVPIDGEDLQRLVEAQDRSEILRGFVERALLT